MFDFLRNVELENELLILMIVDGEFMIVLGCCIMNLCIENEEFS